MMISPDSYVEMELWGKSRENALKKVKGLRKEINHLKRVIEENPYKDEYEMDPSPEVRISVLQDYLTAAKAYFELQKWEYEPSKKEIKIKEFNESLKYLESIEFFYGGFFGTNKSWKVFFDGDKVMVDSIVRLIPDYDMDKLKLPCFDDLTKEDFLNDLRDLQIGEWKREYFNPDILDGTQWSVDLRYSDGKKKHFSGSNMFPYNFNEFLEVMRMDQE